MLATSRGARSDMNVDAMLVMQLPAIRVTKQMQSNFTTAQNSEGREKKRYAEGGDDTMAKRSRLVTVASQPCCVIALQTNSASTMAAQPAAMHLQAIRLATMAHQLHYCAECEGRHGEGGRRAKAREVSVTESSGCD